MQIRSDIDVNLLINVTSRQAGLSLRTVVCEENATVLKSQSHLPSSE